MFDPTSAEFFEDPSEMFRWLREEAPLYHNADPDYWAVSRYEDVFAGYGDWKRLSNRWGVGIQDTPEDDASTVGNILSLDRPDHERLRRLLSRAFTPRAIDAKESLVRDTIAAFLDPLTDRDEFDLVADFATLFPVEVISALLGVPKADRPQIREWTAQRLHREPGELTPSPQARAAFTHLFDYFRDLVADRRNHLGSDLISEMCRAQDDLDGTETTLTDDEIAGFARLLGSAGSETVTKLVGNAAVLFHRNPDQWTKVLHDPTLIPAAVEETVRYWPPVSYSGRRALAPVQFSTGTVPAGARVLLVTGAATHDPRRFDNPDAFDIERDQHRQIGFGFGTHVCIGAHLARLESRIAIQQLATRWPRHHIREHDLTRVHMTNVSGYENVPVTAR
ncbi:MAG TPA: cytochrome P450 [Amycolatopsis sp.]|nr:cytochrome P450 [Amycolatopsis sp.]